MNSTLDSYDDGADEYFVVPEEALKYLPADWRAKLQKTLDDGRAVLVSVDGELSNLIRLTNSFPTLVALKHVKARLAGYEFSATMDAILELDMLTTAFVVTYVRLAQGGNGSGFQRDALPAALRKSHDQIVDLRNKRFAHSTDHHSVGNALDIAFEEGAFHPKITFNLGYHVGGATEWHALVEFLDQMYVERMEKIQGRLRSKTGWDWHFTKGPDPSF